MCRLHFLTFLLLSLGAWNDQAWSVFASHRIVLLTLAKFAVSHLWDWLFSFLNDDAVLWCSFIRLRQLFDFDQSLWWILFFCVSFVWRKWPLLFAERRSIIGFLTPNFVFLRQSRRLARSYGLAIKLRSLLFDKSKATVALALLLTA